MTLDVKNMTNAELREELTKLSQVTEIIGNAFQDGEGGADGLRLAANVLRNGATVVDEIAVRWNNRKGAGA